MAENDTETETHTLIGGRSAGRTIKIPKNSRFLQLARNSFDFDAEIYERRTFWSNEGQQDVFAIRGMTDLAILEELLSHYTPNDR